MTYLEIKKKTDKPTNDTKMKNKGDVDLKKKVANQNLEKDNKINVALVKY